VETVKVRVRTHDHEHASIVPVVVPNLDEVRAFAGPVVKPGYAVIL